MERVDSVRHMLDGIHLCARVGFSGNAVARTEETSGNVYIDIDEKGDLVRMTVEHAKESGALTELIYREADRDSA